ncbi:MAG: lytic murein transglycosylase, partial [Gammaproteobacteria bacterium]
MTFTKTWRCLFNTASFCLLTFSSFSTFAQEQSFAEWLAELKDEALGQGVSEATISAAFALVEEPIPRVLELDRSQPEFVQTFTDYMRNRLSDARIKRGQSLLVEYQDLFQRITDEY